MCLCDAGLGRGFLACNLSRDGRFETGVALKGAGPDSGNAGPFRFYTRTGAGSPGPGGTTPRHSFTAPVMAAT